MGTDLCCEDKDNMWKSGWPPGLFLMCVRKRQGLKEGGDYGRCGGGRRQSRTIWGSWWKRFWQQQESGGDRNKAGMTRARGVWRGGSPTSSSRIVAGGIVILRRRHMTPRWVDDPARRNVGGGSVGAGGCCPPWKGIMRQEEWEGRVKRTST